MKKCRECGKMFDVLWPEMYRYKRGAGTNYTYFCSWGCLRAYDKKMEEKEMDGKRSRSGKKPVVEVADKIPDKKIEIPEATETTMILDAEGLRQTVKKTAMVNKEPLEVYALKSGILADGKYCKEAGGMALRGLSIGGSEIFMKEREWCAFSNEILVALNQLGVNSDE